MRIRGYSFAISGVETGLRTGFLVGGKRVDPRLFQHLGGKLHLSRRRGKSRFTILLVGDLRPVTEKGPARMFLDVRDLDIRRLEHPVQARLVPLGEQGIAAGSSLPDRSMMISTSDLDSPTGRNNRFGPDSHISTDRSSVRSSPGNCRREGQCPQVCAESVMKRSTSTKKSSFIRLSFMALGRRPHAVVHPKSRAWSGWDRVFRSRIWKGSIRGLRLRDQVAPDRITLLADPGRHIAPWTGLFEFVLPVLQPRRPVIVG